MEKWYTLNGINDDIVLSSRVRLARNLEDYPFPNKMSKEQSFEVIQKISDALLKENNSFNLKFIDIEKLSELEIYSMVERYIISPEFAQNIGSRALILSEDESISIMINEEDHIRIQVLSSGMNFENNLETALEIEKKIESKVKLAFDDNLGYLTACPTNLGTALRASAMIHIPCIENVGGVNSLSNSISKLGLTIRGTYGEGSKADSSMYQISNQVTLGITEKDAIDNLKKVITQIIESEKNARNSIEKSVAEDSVYRAYGLLKYARKISANEFSELISKVRLGVSLGILDIPISAINRLFITCQAASLQCLIKREMDANERDEQRAKLIRENI